MFGVDTSELIILAIAALIFIGPKDLPKAMSTVGRWIGQIRGMARHFHSGIETMIREAELEEMEKKWREENERIMREYPALLDGQRAETDQPSLPLEPGSPRPTEADWPPPAAVPGEDELPPEQRELP